MERVKTPSTEINPTPEVMKLAALYDIPIDKVMSITIDTEWITFKLRDEAHSYKWKWDPIA